MRTLIMTLFALLTLPGTVQAQTFITEEQAIDSVCQFSGDPDLNARVVAFRYDEDRLRDYFYEVRVEEETNQALYTVGAADGVVYSATFTRPAPPDEPSMSPQEALAIASDYLRSHYPAFSQRRWRLNLEKYWRHDGRYLFEWTEVINDYGVLARWWAIVEVDGTTGAIISYGIPPPNRILGPTIPRITRQQAIRLAARYTPYDPNVLPFDEVYLMITEDPFGIQRLVWILYRTIAPHPEDRTPQDGVYVDAITGEVVGVHPYGSGAFGGKAKQPAPRLRYSPSYFLRSTNGTPLNALVFPVVRQNKLWVRVEMLRGFGARVQANRGGMMVRAGSKTLTGAQVGAKWQDYGWWIPLRRAAEALGWQVTWWQDKKEAVVDTHPAESRGARALP